jgi:hypothetical protein
MSNPVAQQTHSKFKIFTGKLEADLSLGKLATEVEEFAKSSKAAAKSIGVEYLEASRTLIVTLGYKEGEPGYPVKLHAVKLGVAEKLDAADLARLEKKMEEEAAKLTGVICHELFVTEKREFAMVLMTAATP